MAMKAEQKTVLTVSGKITRVKVIDGGKAVEIYSVPEDDFKKDIDEEFERKFPIIRASKLSLDDDFLKHEPVTVNQTRLKRAIQNAIKKGLKDFRHPAMDPSFDKNSNFVFEAGKEPAVGKSARFFHNKSIMLMPEKNSRMGTLKEYVAFLAILIKYLIEEEGYEISEAWEVVCDDSRKLGNYRNSDKAKLKIEPTGSRKVGMFYDLANVSKVIVDTTSISGYSFVGGYYNYAGNVAPLINKEEINDASYKYDNAVAWIIMDV